MNTRIIQSQPKPPPKDLQYAQANVDEIDKLKKLVKKVDTANKVPSIGPKTPIPINRDPNALKDPDRQAKSLLFNGGIRNAVISREPLAFDNPVEWLLTLKPSLKPYKWQFETLMMAAGYLTPGDYKNKTPITIEYPFKLLLAAANGSGKDAILIAAFSTWFAVTGLRNRCIITSSSFDQVKFQTEPAIRDLTMRANKQFGPIFKSIQFHHVCPELGSEIKLFATDDPGHAEGYHAWDSGKVARIVNEAKSVKPEIFEAMSRWRGVTHDLLVSSPGGKRGHMYSRVANSVTYPQPVILGKFYFRKVTSFDCPHIPLTTIEEVAREFGENSPVYKSSILAEFSDYDEPIVVPESVFDKCYLNPPAWTGSDIGIGLDLAAGGDEDACFVRKGNKIIHSFFFRQSDTDLACSLIDHQLSPWKHSNYIFNADNGGIGQAMIDKLVVLGWSIKRRNNQSPSFNKREFLNLGAEVWFYLKRLIERQLIIIPNIAKLKEQIISRRFRGFDTTQGKFGIQSKSEAKAEGLPSPDRADAFNLCFYSYRPGNLVENVNKTQNSKLVSSEELLKLAHRGDLFKKYVPPSGRLTLMDKKI